MLLDAGVAKHLQRTHVEERGARQRRAAAQALHRQRGYSMLGQEHCRRQADQATAGEQDWSFRSIGDATRAIMRILPWLDFFREVLRRDWPRQHEPRSWLSHELATGRSDWT